MAYKYQLTKNAVNDIDNIVGYITSTLCNKEAADSFLKEFEDSISRACDFPYGCPAVRNSYYLRNDIRKMIVKKYIAYYKVDGKNEALIIIGVKHSSSNTENFLKHY